MQPHKTDELATALDLCGPKTPAAFGDQGLTAISDRVAFDPVEGHRKEFHDPWVCVHDGERFSVRCTPLAQAEPFGLEFYGRSFTAMHNELLRQNFGIGFSEYCLA